jgi:hypothetical protein
METNKSNKNILMGGLLGVLFLVKHSLGIFMAIPMAILLLIDKKYKPLLIRIGSFIGVVLVEVIYLLFNNILDDAFIYTFLNLKNFSNSLHAYYINIVIVVIILAMIVFGMRYIVKKYYHKEDKPLILYPIFFMLIIYPIFDYYHFIVGVIPFLFIIFKYVKIKDLKIVNGLIMIVLSLITLNSIREYIISYKSNINSYKYVKTDVGYDQKILDIDNYIKDKVKVGYKPYIMNVTAGVYYIPISYTTYFYDLLARGNLGIKSDNQIIEDIDSKSKAIYLIKEKDAAHNWLDDMDVINHVRDNYTKIDSIYEYEIYVKKTYQ